MGGSTEIDVGDVGRLAGHVEKADIRALRARHLLRVLRHKDIPLQRRKENMK